MAKHEVLPSDPVCTTQKAAEILGLSVTSVQQLVESGALEAWKTRGGHRRIPIEAVHRYKAALQHDATAHDAPQSAAGSAGGATILVVEDNEMHQVVYARQFALWNLPVKLLFCDNGYQALISIARHRPQIVLADIVMDGIDGYEVVRTVLADPELSAMHIAIVSSQSEGDLAARGGIPPGVVFFPKPVNYDELRGYVKACLAQVLRKHSPGK